MSNESRRHSTPLNSAVDLSVVRVLRVLDPIARSSICEYFLAGATARGVADEWVTQLLRQGDCKGVQEVFADETTDEKGGTPETESKGERGLAGF